MAALQVKPVTMSSRFTLNATPARARTRTPIPRASDLVIQEGPTPPERTTREVIAAPVLVAIFKTTNVAGDLWAPFEGTQAELYQIQIHQDEKARPNVLFDFQRAFDSFLLKMKKSDDCMPSSVKELETIGIKFINSKPDDPDNVGVVPWRKAFYVAGEPESKPASNFLMLLDDFWKYKAAELSHEFKVFLHPHTSADISDAWDDLAYPAYSFEDPTSKLPLKFWEAWPVVGKRIVSMYIQTTNENGVDILFGGHTYPFKARFDAQGVRGGTANNVYFRKLENVDIGDEGQLRELTNILGSAVLNNLSIRIVLDHDPKPDSNLSSLVALLDRMDNCHLTS